jgi:hypothetical protein
MYLQIIGNSTNVAEFGKEGQKMPVVSKRSFDEL